MMLLRTDTLAGASPEVLAALSAASDGEMSPYGDDPITERMTRKFSDLFGRDVEVYPTVTGTAANALSLALIAPPYSGVYCHDHAHVIDGEMGAFEFYAQGARLVPVGGADGRIDPDLLEERLDLDAGRPSHPPAAAVTVTQLAEAGTLYRADEVRRISAICRERGLKLHMDGARFAVAVAAMGVSPAEASAELGVDILSFGGTKNGTLMADAIVVFTPGLTSQMKERRKRAGLTLAKMRFLSAQLEAYVTDDLWLRNARRANTAMRRLSEAIGGLRGVSFQYAPEGNELFLVLDAPVAAAVAAAGVPLRRKSENADGAVLYRLVTSFATTDEQVDSISRAIEDASRRA